MKKLKIICSILLVMAITITAMPISVSAGAYYSSKTVAVGETYKDSDFSLQSYNGEVTFTNNGTMEVTGKFSLESQAKFVNNGTLTVEGSPSTFAVQSGCSFENKGTMEVSNLNNFGCYGAFVNEGVIYLDSVWGINTSGLVNKGTIVYGDSVPGGIVNDLLAASVPYNGTVVSKKDYDPSNPPAPTKTKYAITYDLNGGKWSGTEPAADDPICSYDTTNGQGYYKIGMDEPFQSLNTMVEREHYVLAGWTCEKQTEPSLYMDIMCEWKSDITLTAHWKPKNYLISYRLDGGYFKDEDAKDMTSDDTYFYANYNIESDTFTLPVPEKSGYTFGGWICRDGSVESSITIEKGSTGNKVYKAKWIPKGDTPYTVEVYYMDTAGNYGTNPDKSISEKGATGDVVLVSSAYEKDGFSFDDKKSVSSGTITADGKLVLSLYYAREQYDINFMSSDGNDLLHTYKAYYGSDIAFGGKTPTLTQEDFTCTFAGWSRIKESNHALDDLGKATQSANFYAVFDKEQTRYTITFGELTGFLKPDSTEYKVDKGDSFVLSLVLASDDFCVGTDDWAIIYDGLHIGGDAANLFFGEDYTLSHKGYGEPLVLTIPKVTSDLKIEISAKPHESHDFDENKDVVIREATCVSTGEVSRYCYMCGKTVMEQISIDSENHTNLKHIEAKEATVETEGNTEYWHCKDCGKYFSDKDAKKEIQLADTVIAKLPKPEDNNGTDDDNKEDETPSVDLPYLGGDSSVNGWEKLEEKLEQSQEKETITIEMNGTVTVPKEVFDTIRGKDVTVVFDMGNGISWTINGTTVTETDIDSRNMQVIVGEGAGLTIPDVVLKDTVGKADFVKVTLVYSGEFGFTATLSINVEKTNAGKYANLYYYNPNTNALEYVCAGKIDADGNTALNFTHASDYVIVIDEKDMGINSDDTKDDTGSDDNDTKDDIGSKDDDVKNDTGSDNNDIKDDIGSKDDDIKSDTGSDDNDTKDDIGSKNDDVKNDTNTTETSPKTGDSSKPMLYIGWLILAVSQIFFFRKRIKNTQKF